MSTETIRLIRDGEKKYVYKKSFIPTAVSVLNAEFLNYNMFQVMKCACACVCACVCAGACGCMHVLNITHVFAGVCQWKKPGQASGKRM